MGWFKGKLVHNGYLPMLQIHEKNGSQRFYAAGRHPAIRFSTAKRAACSGYASARVVSAQLTATTEWSLTQVPAET
jgi:hypothetical protein